MPSVLYRVTHVVRETLGSDELRLRPETTPADVDGWDSVAHVQIFLALESEFDVALTPEELASIGSVGDILALLAKRGIEDA